MQLSQLEVIFDDGGLTLKGSESPVAMQPLISKMISFESPSVWQTRSRSRAQQLPIRPPK